MALPARLPDTAASEDAPPPVLLPYQKRWIADKSPLKIIEKSRRTGVTWAEAADNVLTAAAEKAAGGQNIYYIGYNQDMTLEYIQAAAMWARAFQRAASAIEEGIWKDDQAMDKEIKTFTIRFPESGHRIVALSSRPSNLRGRQGVIVLDEAAFHDDLPELLKAAMAMRIWGGAVHVISTHNGADNPFNELIGEIRAGKREGTIHRVPFMEAVRDGLYRRVCLRLGQKWSARAEGEWVASVYALYGEDAAEELDAIPSQGAGAFLSRALIEAAMGPDVPVLRFSQPESFTLLPARVREEDTLAWCEALVAPLLARLHPTRKCWVGEDFGRITDLTVLWPLCQKPDLVLESPFVVELAGIPFEQQRQILFFLIDHLPRFQGVALDARGNGQYLAEVTAQKYGAARVAQVMLSTEWYREHTPRLKAALADGTLLLPRDELILEDLRALKVEKGVARIPEGVRTGGGKRHGDAAIALIMGMFAAKTMDAAPMEFQTLGPRGVLAGMAGFHGGGRGMTGRGFGSVGPRFRPY